MRKNKNTYIAILTIITTSIIIVCGIILSLGDFEYIESNNLCGMRPVFLGEGNSEKFLLAFKGEKEVCFQKIEENVEYISVNDKVITLFDDNREVIKSLDSILYTEVEETAKFTEPQIANDGDIYTYTYVSNDIVHNGNLEIGSLKFKLLDVN